MNRDNVGQQPEAYWEALKLADAGADASVVLAALRRAADDGDDRAKYAIATWLLSGQEGALEADIPGGVALLKELENSCVAEALFDLAVTYDLGRGARRNENKAFSLYMRAALLGSREACAQVAGFYNEGKDVKHDRRLAAAWRKRAGMNESDISPPYRAWLRPPTSQLRGHDT